MLKVKTKLDRSKIAGIGVFADQEIKKSEVIWQMNNLSAFKITIEDYKKLSQEEKDFIEEKDYYWIDENGRIQTD